MIIIIIIIIILRLILNESSYFRPTQSTIKSYNKEYHLLGYDAVESVELYPTFRCHLLARWFAELSFDPEDGGDTFLRNVGHNSTDYTASYPRI
jgi:hypothetical protein